MCEFYKLWHMDQQLINILSQAATHRLVKDGAQVMLVTGLPISFHIEKGGEKAIQSITFKKADSKRGRRCGR
jgi:predicted FMN-binding regulatory protein PaiB